LSYAAFSRATEVSVDLSYSALDLEDRELDDDFDAGDLTEDGGRRDRITARVGLVTGRTGFFGTVTELSYRDDSFSDGAVEDDETFLSLGTTLRFTLDPRITLRATGFASQEDTDDALNTVETIHSYGLGADLLIDRLWTANIDVGYREIETETGAVTQIVDGTTAAFLLTREMRNGVFSFSATRDITNTGFEDTVRLRRALTLANGAEVDFSLGAVIFEGADPIAIYGASYANEIRPGMRLRLAFDRSGGVTDDDENIIRTRLTTDLAHNLTEASSLVLGADLSQVEEAGLAGTDTTQVDLSLAYRYALTRDWTLAARARHGIVFEDGADTERSTVFSIGVERAWITPEYSHGPLIPLISLYLFLRELRQTGPQSGRLPSVRWPGVVVIAGPGDRRFSGNIVRIPDIVTYGFIIWVGGVVLTVYGWERGKRTSCPCCT
jgi:hypothetical protein